MLIDPYVTQALHNLDSGEGNKCLQCLFTAAKSTERDVVVISLLQTFPKLISPDKLEQLSHKCSNLVVFVDEAHKLHNRHLQEGDVRDMSYAEVITNITNELKKRKEQAIHDDSWLEIAKSHLEDGNYTECIKTLRICTSGEALDVFLSKFIKTALRNLIYSELADLGSMYSTPQRCIKDLQSLQSQVLKAKTYENAEMIAKAIRNAQKTLRPTQLARS